jgi:hypothetical protein
VFVIDFLKKKKVLCLILDMLRKQSKIPFFFRLLHLSVAGSGGKHNQLWKSNKISFSCRKQVSDRNWDPEIEMQSISLSVTCVSFLVNFFLCPFGGWSKYYSYGS